MTAFPFVKQPDTMDCGVACLKMIASHYGRNYTIETLRRLCYCSREGVSLLSISETAEKIGFKTVGGKVGFNDLMKKAILPCVIHWNQEHFVVVYHIEQKNKNDYSIAVADPGIGLITYSAQEFKEKWLTTCSGDEEKGVALLVEPTARFYHSVSEKEGKSGLKLLFSYFSKYRRFFIHLILGLLVGSGLQLTFPFLTQAIVDVGINTQNIHFIYLILIAQLVLFISRMSVDFIRSWILLHISTRINISMLSDFLIKLMRLPMCFFDTKMTGDIIQRMEDHQRVENFLTAQTLSFLFSIVNFFVFGIVLWIYSFKIFLIFLGGSLLYFGWIVLFLKKRRILDNRRFEQMAINQSKTYQIISGMQEIKLQHCERRRRWEWEDVQAELFNLNIKELGLGQYQEAGRVFINETKNLIITIVAATAVIQGSLTLGMMLAIQYIIGQLNSPIEQMVKFVYDFQDAKISLERINEIHNKQDENEDKEEWPALFQGGDIHIRNLTFQYEGPHSPKVLDQINLSIPQGKVTAIVGASGSGKTTLIKLLLQYYNPVEGEIKINNINLNTSDAEVWRQHCGVVMQDGFIFSESIARNIAIADGWINEERLLHAARIANIHDFIMRLPLKYNTQIGQEGQGISQGQRQRLLIARAVYKNPDFIFLDEATNALDANNERTIVENLSEFYKGKTVIVVAHRLSTVKYADQIIVLHKGKIVETGTHQELTFRKGYYYTLVKNQLELGN